MANFELLSFATADDLARAAASAWLDEIEAAHRAGKPIASRSPADASPKNFSPPPSSRPKRAQTSFDCVHFFWADERCVPPDDPESNFKMANELLFAPLKIAAEKIHRLRGEDPPPVAVKIAEAELCRIATKKSRTAAGFGFDFSRHGRGRAHRFAVPERNCKNYGHCCPVSGRGEFAQTAADPDIVELPDDYRREKYMDFDFRRRQGGGVARIFVVHRSDTHGARPGGASGENIFRILMKFNLKPESGWYKLALSG